MTNYQQHDQNDCGAACLAGIAGYYGKPLSIAHVRILAGTDDLGTTLDDLQHVAIKSGFLAEAVAVEGARDISAFGGWRNFLETSAA